MLCMLACVPDHVTRDGIFKFLFRCDNSVLSFLNDDESRTGQASCVRLLAF